MRILTASVPGTGPDFIARLVASKLSENGRVNAIVENRPSVNGIVAAQLVSKAAPDGSVLIMGNAGTHAINQINASDRDSILMVFPADLFSYHAAFPPCGRMSAVLLSEMQAKGAGLRRSSQRAF